MRPFLRFLFWTAVAVGSVVGILRLVALRWWTLPEDDPWLVASVAPTLRAGDTVLLWRGTKPTVTNLVVCPDPGAPGRVVLGRIVGEAGDKVKLIGRGLSVNERPERSERSCLERTFEVSHPRTGEPVEQSCEMADLEGALHMRGVARGHTPAPLDQEFEVPEDALFLVSDNRVFPFDSRDFGPVPRDTCRETVFFRLWSKAGFRDRENRFVFIQ